jgi:hypothetical protein
MPSFVQSLWIPRTGSDSHSAAANVTSSKSEYGIMLWWFGGECFEAPRDGGRAAFSIPEFQTAAMREKSETAFFIIFAVFFMYFICFYCFFYACAPRPPSNGSPPPS